MGKTRNRAGQQVEDHRKHPEDETDGKTGNQKKSEYRKFQSDMIFIVLCLVTFSVLSLGNAKREDALSRRSADSVQEYYRADAAGEAFLQLADQALLKGDKDSLMPYLQSASGTYCTDVAMNAGQALRVELALDWEQKTYQVLSWKVYHQEDYEIDQSIPVWSGN